MPQVCGRCGVRCPTPAELEVHAAWCWVPEVRAVDAVRMLSNATISLADRLPAREAAAITYLIQRAALGLTDEQRIRLAWLVDEFGDAIDAVVRRAARDAVAGAS